MTSLEVVRDASALKMPRLRRLPITPKNHTHDASVFLISSVFLLDLLLSDVCGITSCEGFVSPFFKSSKWLPKDSPLFSTTSPQAQAGFQPCMNKLDFPVHSMVTDELSLARKRIPMTLLSPLRSGRL